VPSFAVPVEPTLPLIAASGNAKKEEEVFSIGQLDKLANSTSFVHLFWTSRCAGPDALAKKIAAIFTKNSLSKTTVTRGRKPEAAFLKGNPVEGLWCTVDDHCVVYISAHPSIADRTSLELLREQVEASVDISDPKFLFRDYAIWERDNYDSGRLKESLYFYSRVLANCPTSIELPTDSFRPAILPVNRTKRLCVEIPDRALSFLKQFGENMDLAFSVACGAVLCRHAIKQKNMLCGLINRRRTGLDGCEKIIGPLQNVCPLKVDMESFVTFQELLGSLQEQMEKYQSHARFPFPLLCGVLDQSVSRTPLIQLATAVTSLVENEVLSDGEASHHAELTMELRGTVLNFFYNSALYNVESVEFLSEHLATFLSNVTLSSPVLAVPMMDVEERERVIGEFNHWHAEQIIDPLEHLHSAFEKFAQTTPKAPALWMSGQILTYGELNARANAITLELGKAAVKLGDFVAIFCERSFEFIIAALAILKMGAVFVPIDTAYPEARIEYILNDSEAVVVLLTKSTKPKIPSSFPGRMWEVDADADSPSSGDDNREKALSFSGFDHLAYMIYTSGTTGNPKGVEIFHAGAVAYCKFWVAECAIGPNDRYMWFSGTAFDSSIEEVWGTLTAGACIVIRTDMWLEDLSQCTFFGGTPSALTVVDPADYPDLTTVICGGEALPPALSRLWRSKVKLCNSYGPTECSVAATLSIIKPDEERISIGRPNYNLSAYVLDESLEAQPIGVVGEIAFAGIQVGRGYHNLEAKTRASFVPNPYADEFARKDVVPRPRMYLTGDLGRWLPNGEIEYLGRKDSQVKIRGYRIEISSVESVIMSLHGVEGCAVIVSNLGTPNAQLVAYVCPLELNISQIRKEASELLPKFMVPTTIIPLDTMPLTANGKLDKRALPAATVASMKPQKRLKESQDQPSGRHVTLSPTERMLQEVWMTVLKLDNQPPGRDARFFDVGGNSITAMKIAFSLRKRDFALDVTDVIALQTISAMAKKIDGSPVESNESSFRGVQVSPDVMVNLGESEETCGNIIVLVHGTNGALGRMRLVRNEILKQRKDVPVYGLHLTSKMQLSTLAQLAAVYVTVLRTRFASANFVIAGEGAGALIGYEMTRQLLLAGERVSGLVLIGNREGECSSEEDIELGAYLSLIMGKREDETQLKVAKNRDKWMLHRLKGVAQKDLVRQKEMWKMMSQMVGRYVKKMRSGVKLEVKAFSICSQNANSILRESFFGEPMARKTISTHWSALLKDGADEISAAILSSCHLEEDLTTSTALPDSLTMSSKIDDFISQCSESKRPISLASSQLIEFHARPSPSASQERFHRPVMRRVATTNTFVLKQQEVLEESLQRSMIGVSQLGLAISQPSIPPAWLPDLESEISVPLPFLSTISELDAPPVLTGDFEGAVLVTGATGFLGPFIVRSLLKASPGLTVICIARAKDDEAARERVVGLVSNTLPLKTGWEEQLVVYAGDLSEIRFGLELSCWNSLQDSISFILHNGALVNHLLEFNQMSATNIGGVKTVLELASTGTRSKRVVIVTTVGTVPVLAGETLQSPAKESTDLVKAGDIVGEGGYCGTKWVAEQLLVRANKMGLCGSIARPAMIGWETGTGICNQADWVVGLIKACLLVKTCPFSESRISLAPVEFVADACTAPLYGAELPHVYHVAHNQTYKFSRMFDALDRVCGKMDRVPFGKWLERCRSRAVDEESTKLLAPTLLLLGSLDDLPEERVYETANAERIMDSARAVNERLHVLHPLDDAYFDAVVRYLKGLSPSAGANTK
jgi:amino acid adenylation domain-containing protein/thioester reductase-like protein